MKIAYFDCFSGISGDMCLGALIDAGVSIKDLDRELKKIPVRGFRLITKKVKRSHFLATKVDVILQSTVKSKQPKIKRWEDIEKIIHSSSLSEDTKYKVLKIFKRLFKAEAKVHGKTFNTVHLHELGAVDCIADVFGTVIGLNMLGIERVYASPVNLGSGVVKSENAILPVPAPATADILRKIPVYSKSVPFELTTPTGAAIIRELVSEFGDIPYMDIERIGLGAGNKDFSNWPNVLRILIGKEWPLGDNKKDDSVIVIETNIDDMNPQIFDYVMEKLYKAGALDVFLTQVIMKKGRPGVKLTVLCDRERRDEMIKIILTETTTIGLRYYETKRKVLKREIKAIDTDFGKIRFKFSGDGKEILKACPEYEDCKKAARRLRIPLIDLMKKSNVKRN